MDTTTQHYVKHSATEPRDSFLDELTAFATQHRAEHWHGTFAQYLEDILPKDPIRFSRSSHQYLYDMLCWYRDRTDGSSGEPASALCCCTRSPAGRAASATPS